MNLLLLYRIKCLPKNTNGRLAIPALAGLLVLGLLQWTMWHVAGWMRPLGGPLKIGGPRLQPCQPSGKSGLVRDSYSDNLDPDVPLYPSQNCGCIISSASVISRSMVQISCWLYENWENREMPTMSENRLFLSGEENKYSCSAVTRGPLDRFNSKIPPAQFFFLHY